MRLVIDARMLDHSGIGVYLSNVLPRVLPGCSSLAPLLLTLPRLESKARAIAGNAAQVRAWAVPPLSLAELGATNPVSNADLWWAPHFNVPLRSRVPLVVTLHDLLPLGYNDASAKPHKRLVVRVWLRAIRQRARRVICVSQFTREQAVRIGGIPVAKTSVVHLGVDAAWSAGNRQAARSDAPYVICVGLVKPHKNLLALLQAFETLMPAVPHRLVLVGKHTGIRAVDHAALALAARLAPRVEVLEDLPQAVLIRLVAGADLLIQPSLHEGFGLPALEAMAAGTPVLAARAGALPEVCGDAAAYCDPHSHLDIAQAMRRLLENAQLREPLRERGIRRARAFTWQACANATTETLLAAWSER